jgi:hypothetical protein
MVEADGWEKKSFFFFPFYVFIFWRDAITLFIYLFAVLGLKLRAYTLSHFSSPFLFCA